MRLCLTLSSIVLLLTFAVGGHSQTIKTIYLHQTIPDDWNPGFKIGRSFGAFLFERLKIAGISLTEIEANSDAVMKCEPSIVITIHRNDPDRSVYSCQLFSTASKKKRWKDEVSFLEMKDPKISDERAAETISKKFISRYRKGIKY